MLPMDPLAFLIAHGAARKSIAGSGPRPNRPANRSARVR
jgi:hypothetical protein